MVLLPFSPLPGFRGLAHSRAEDQDRRSCRDRLAFSIGYPLGGFNPDPLVLLEEVGSGYLGVFAALLIENSWVSSNYIVGAAVERAGFKRYRHILLKFDQDFAERGAPAGSRLRRSYYSNFLS